jgi:hypothetical protein
MDYRKQLIDSCIALQIADRGLFIAALNLAMSGELKEVNEAFDTGDVFEFEWGHLDNCSDVNLTKILTVHQSINSTLSSLININNITDRELSDANFE